MNDFEPQLGAEAPVADATHAETITSLGEHAIGLTDSVNSGDLLVSSVTAEAIDNLGSYIESGRQDPETRVLYEEQVPVMEDLYDFLVTHANDPRGRIVLPTGVGKTVLFTEFVKATGLRTLVLTPTRNLLSQTEKAFSKFGGTDDVTVGKIFSGKKDESGQVTITTYASFVRHTKDKDSPYLGPGKYDLIICDEAHHALAPGTSRALKEYEGVVKVGLTATEDYSKNKKLEHDFPYLIHKMEIREAIESNLISPFSNWVVETDTDMSRVAITPTNEYSVEQLQDTINDELRNRLAVDMYRTFFAGQKAIFFCSGVQHAKDMAEMLRKEGVRAEAAHGGLTPRRQDAIKNMLALEDDEEGLMVVTNDKLFTEGTDVVNLTVCFNLAPTLSLVRARQRARNLRIDPQNPSKHAYVVDFVDKNYRKPPVLFADPDVAAAAQIGGIDPEAPEGIDLQYNLGNVVIHRSPEAVEAMALAFWEGRQDPRLPAPEGWMTISAIAEFLDVSMTEAKKLLSSVKEIVPEQIAEESGRFLSRGVKDGLTTFYSPNIADAMDEFKEEVLSRRLQPAPDNWLTSGQVSHLYGLEYMKTQKGLRQYARTFEEEAVSGIFRQRRPFAATKTEFFDPAVVKVFTLANGLELWRGQPPSDWSSETDIRDLYGPHIAREAIRYGERNMSGLFSRSTVIIDGERHLGPRAREWIKLHTAPPKGWVDTSSVTNKLDISHGLLNEIISYYQQEHPRLFDKSARWCFEGGGEARYINSSFVDTVERYLKDNHEVLVKAGKISGSSAVKDMVEGEPIKIPHAELISGMEIPEASDAIDGIAIEIERKKHERDKKRSPRKPATQSGVRKASRPTNLQGDRKPRKGGHANFMRKPKELTRLSLADIEFEEFAVFDDAPVVQNVTAPEDELEADIPLSPTSPAPVSPPVVQSSPIAPIVSSKANLMRKYRR